MSSLLHTPLCQLLGCRYPVVQTAMGWVADPALVAATCNGGGFGFLAGATIPPGEMEAAIVETRRRTEQPFGVNFHMFQPNAGDIVALVLKYGIRAVSYGRGPQPDMIRRLKEGGTVCMPTVGALRHAVKAVEMGADVVTIQGGEGGGHTGAVPTSILLPQVLDAVSVPVVAAGGFRDGRGLAAALAWGAAGIAMGTRFLLTSDSPVPAATKQRYLACRNPADVVVSRALDGLPHRMVLNEYLSFLERASPLRRLFIALRSGLAYRKFTGASPWSLLRTALFMRRSGGITASQAIMSANAPMIIQKAMVDGQPEQGALPGGQVAGAIEDLPSCARLLESIAAEAEQSLARFARPLPEAGQASP